MTNYTKYKTLIESFQTGSTSSKLSGLLINTLLENKLSSFTQDDIKHIIVDDKLDLLKNKSIDAILRYKEHKKLLN